MKLSAMLQTVRNAICPAVLAAAAVSCLASCSGEPTPDVPMERSRVLIRLFSSLDRDDYSETLKDIETYRNLDQTNLFLSDFEHLVRANNVIAEARAKLDAGDYAGAVADFDAYIQRYGDVSEPINQAKAKADLLLRAQTLNEKLLAAEFSEDLRTAANDLDEFAKANPKLFPKLKSYAAAKVKEADALAAVERQDACIAMFQDAVEARRAGRSAEADALTALIEMNADPAQIAEFAAWLEHRNAQQSPTAL